MRRDYRVVSTDERVLRRGLFGQHVEARTLDRVGLQGVEQSVGVDDRTLHSAHDFLDALAFWLEDDDPDPLYEVVEPAERILEGIPSVVIAETAAREVANGAPVYAPGVLDADEGLERDTLVACYTPNGAAVCLGTVVGDPEADSGLVVDLERVLV